jgi:hypothetical protein
MNKPIVSVPSIRLGDKLGKTLGVVDNAARVFAQIFQSEQADDRVVLSCALWKSHIVWLQAISKTIVADIEPRVIVRVEQVGPRLVRLMNIVVCPPYVDPG